MPGFDSHSLHGFLLFTMKECKKLGEWLTLNGNFFFYLHEWDTLHSCGKKLVSKNCAIITIKALYLHAHYSWWPLTFLIVVFTIQCSSSQSWWLLVGGNLCYGCLISTFQHLNAYGLWAGSCTENRANSEGFVVRTELFGMPNAVNTMSTCRAHKNMLLVQGFHYWELLLLKVLTV